MNYQQFLEKTDKEFDEEFVQNGGVLPHHRDGGRILKEELKFFIHSRLRALLEEVERNAEEELRGKF